MATPEAIFGELQKITADLIAAGICTDQNFPALISHGEGVVTVGLTSTDRLSITMKNIPYPQSYRVLAEDRLYSMRMIDGGLIQLMYTFVEYRLQKHRLAFFPSPDLLEYQNNPEIYETDELYADVISQNIVSTPIRFDFDRTNFAEVAHPMCHLTIGQYKNCRIPVSAPLTPHAFLDFILRAFYNTPYQNLCTNLTREVAKLERTISGPEHDQIYLQACGF